MNSIYTVSVDRNDGVGVGLVEKLNVKLPVVFVSLQEDLNFNEEILSLKGQKYCLVDFTELGWNWNMEYGHHFGVNTEKFPSVFNYNKWKVFDDFVKETPPALIFCRELLKEDVRDNVYSIQYPCFISPQPVQTKEEFNNRLFDVFYNFGISHEYRKKLHGSIWVKSGQYGYSVCDNLQTINQFIQNEQGYKKWISVHTPHYSRLPIEYVIDLNGHAKISISIAGAGRNCFRHSESPVNSVMLMWEDNLAWGDSWVSGYNCIKCEQGNEIETIVEALKNPDLYQIYLNGMKTVDKFRFDNYIPYLESIINSA